MDNLPLDKQIILFDGICNLCDNTVLKIIQYDKHDKFRFASLKGELGLQILKHIGVDPNTTDSIVLYQPGVAYYLKSQAAFKIASQIQGPYKLVSFLRVLPHWFTDKIYDYIAKNRYKWYGKKQQCSMPNTQLVQKFL